jgi:hypothetical protein
MRSPTSISHAGWLVANKRSQNKASKFLEFVAVKLHCRDETSFFLCLSLAGKWSLNKINVTMCDIQYYGHVKYDKKK